MSQPYQQSFSKRVDTSETSKPNNPQLEIRNPLRASLFINAIDLILDPEFAYKGVVEFYAGNRLIFDSSTESLKNFSIFSIPLQNDYLDDREKISIYAWNKTDGNKIGFTSNLIIGEQNVFLGAGSKSLTRDKLNELVSDSEILFAHKLRYNETETKLINMEGYKKLITSMSASTVQLSMPYFDPSFPENDIGNTISFTNDNGKQFAKAFDFYDNKSKQVLLNLIFKHKEYQRTTPGAWNQLIYFRLDKIEASDVADFSSGVIVLESPAKGFTKTPINDGYGCSTGSSFCRSVTQTLNYSTTTYTSKRFVKIYVTALLSSSGFAGGMYKPTTTTINRLNTQNKMLSGGSAKLSFEIKDAGEQWQELIPYTEFGTVTYGNTVLRQIGNVVSRDTGTKVGFILPSTQTNFRAKLVTTGGIETGVNILKVL